MKLVTAMCPNCGAKLELDENMEKGFCMYCGSHIIVDDAVQKYKIELSGKVSVEGILTADDLAKNGETLLGLENFAQAAETYEEMTKKYPGDWRGWWGMVRAVTMNMELMPGDEDHFDDLWSMAEEYFDYVKKLAPERERAEALERYGPWRETFYGSLHSMELDEEYARCKGARSGTLGAQVSGGFSAAKGLVMLILVSAAALLFVLIVGFFLILTIFECSSMGERILCLVLAGLAAVPLVKLLTYLFGDVIPDFRDAVDYVKGASDIRSETKRRMAEIDRERGSRK